MSLKTDFKRIYCYEKGTITKNVMNGRGGERIWIFLSFVTDTTQNNLIKHRSIQHSRRFKNMSGIFVNKKGLWGVEWGCWSMWKIKKTFFFTEFSLKNKCLLWRESKWNKVSILCSRIYSQKTSCDLWRPLSPHKSFFSSVCHTKYLNLWPLPFHCNHRTPLGNSLLQGQY